MYLCVFKHFYSKIRKNQQRFSLQRHSLFHSLQTFLFEKKKKSKEVFTAASQPVSQPSNIFILKKEKINKGFYCSVSVCLQTFLFAKNKKSTEVFTAASQPVSQPSNIFILKK